MRTVSAALIAWTLCLSPWAIQPVAAQAAFDNQYVPDDAIVAAFLPVDEILSDPSMEWMPIEIIQAQVVQSVGLDPLDVATVKAIAGLPGPAGPNFAAIIQFKTEFQIGELSDQWVDTERPESIGDKTVYRMRQMPMAVVHQAAPATLVVANDTYLDVVLSADEGTGSLPALITKLPAAQGAMIVGVMQPIRPLVTTMLRQNASQLPPPMRGLADVGELTDAVLVNLDHRLTSGSMSVALLGRDEDSAAQLEQSLNEAIDFGRDQLMAQAMGQMDNESPVDLATQAYMKRVGARITEMLRPQVSGKVVKLNMEGNVATTGVLVGLLLPAVQAAREAARRMNASNELKMIGLAMHNYHSAYNHLPDRAIRDADGKPLLSWRVAILPFIEHEALYKRFHLDEPWDSEHNLTLLAEMPEVYVDPSAQLAPGETVFQAITGDGRMFPADRQAGFRDILDGLSNTLMVVETSQAAAVAWTKPVDVEIDPANPLANMGDSHQGGFHVLMGDGSVKFITYSVNVDLFRGLLTAAGQEVVDF